MQVPFPKWMRSLSALCAAGLLTLAPLSTALFAAGCSPGDGMTGDGDGDIIDELVDVYIAYFEACFYPQDAQATLFELLEPGSDPETVDLAPLGDFLRAQFESEHVTVDEALLQDCIDGIDALISTCGQFDDELNDTCQSSITGALTAGEACQYSTECQNQNCVLDENDCGTCEAYLQLGDDCSTGTCDPNSDPELYCYYGENEAECRAYLAIGEPCAVENAADCAGDGWCDVAGSGNCEPPAAVGESCEEAPCGDGAYCDYGATPEVCVQYPAQGNLGVGDTCLLQVGCNAYYTQLACVADDEGNGTGVCTQIVAVEEGGVCNASYSTDPNAELHCLHAFTTHYCDYDFIAGEGTCQPRAVAGESCNDNVLCEVTATEEYDDVTFDCLCEALPGDGEPCTEFGDCAYPLDCVYDEENPDDVGTCGPDEGDSLFDLPMCMET